MVMNVHVFTPDNIICSITADEIVLPGLTGRIGILNNHATLVTALDTGLLRIKLNNKWTLIILCGGLVEIDQNSITILAKNAEKIKNLELSNVLKKLEQETLTIENLEKNKDKLDALNEFKKETARLEAMNYIN